jgi:MFS family permease
LAPDHGLRDPRSRRSLLDLRRGPTGHGFWYAFFVASVYIFVDEQFPKDARASAQGLFNFLILGLGPFVGSLLWGGLGDAFRTAAGGVDFSRLFLVPAFLGLVAAALLFLGFYPTRPTLTVHTSPAGE